VRNRLSTKKGGGVNKRDIRTGLMGAREREWGNKEFHWGLSDKVGKKKVKQRRESEGL